MSTLSANRLTDLTGKTILNNTGGILQVVYQEYTTQFSLSAALSYQVFFSQTVTASGNNSRYLLNGNTHAYSSSGNGRCNIGYSVTVGGSTTRIIGVDGASGDSWGQISYPGGFLNRHAIYTSTATAGTQLTFNFLVAGYDTTTTFNYAGYGHKATFSIMEISA